MSFKSALFVLFSFFAGGNILFAQSGTTTSEVGDPNEFQERGIHANENWSYFVDEEHQIYFIDFETINVNLSSVVLKNDKGVVVFQDNVVDLPVNTIYELDFSQYGKGRYSIELQSFTGVLRKEVTIR